MKKRKQVKKKAIKTKKVPEPKYCTSLTNEKVINYKVYYMSKSEKALYGMISFIAGIALGYLFYGGLAQDEYGNATTMTHILNIVVMIVVGLIAMKLFFKLRSSQLRIKRLEQLRRQFVDLLGSLVTSISAGKNIPNSFQAAYNDLNLQYSKSDFIVIETAIILNGMQNGINIEDLLEDFSVRSEIKDIAEFGTVFKTVYRKGGNMKEVIRNCNEIISNKIQIEQEIATQIASSKNEINIMCVMPVVLVAMMKFSGPDFAKNFSTPIGVVCTTIAIVFFVAAYAVGNKMMKIKV